MLIAAITIFLAAFLISIAGTFLARRYARKLGLMDAPGHRKVHTTATPRNGGIGIFCGFALPLLFALTTVYIIDHYKTPGNPQLPDSSAAIFNFPIPGSVLIYLPGARSHIPLLLLFLAATFLIHLLGLLDDRKPLAPWPKLLAQIAISASLIFFGEILAPGSFRILTTLGLFPSAILSVLWIVALTNAFNFLDNMDGLSAGVAFICAAMFLIAALFNQQWFIVGLLLTFMGSVLGFLMFNFPPASIFMGDGGSMILGFILSVLTIRTTYYDSSRPDQPHNWYSVLMPLFVMAVPLYDLLIVSVLRLLKGRSPMTGDTNHFSHRLTRHGFSKRSAVLIIYAVTAATGFSAPLLARLSPGDHASALLLTAQLASTLLIIAILERLSDTTQ